MTEIEIAVAWLRQREGEADEAWIERLLTVFATDPSAPDDPMSDRIGERAWKRFQARFEADRKDT